MLMKSQHLAQAAFQRIEARCPLEGKKRRPIQDEYRSFAREFPTLVHTCGLAQAVAFARAKGGPQEEYVLDLAAVLTAAGHANAASVDSLATQTRTLALTSYLRLSRDALDAAVWLKRYVEAFKDSPVGETKEAAL